ncbi:MAG TPA: gephyrin-like molybdotransferase Glp [Rectinemataceae bacterium]|nr:gephyrin-like molybdotransferase Glp [Rectinemataceae bacterium]
MSEELLHPDEALRLVLEAGRAAFRASLGGGTESLPLAAALGRHMPAAILATLDQPPFDKSAMDGFAVGMSLEEARRFGEGRQAVWEVVGTIAAGSAAEAGPGPGRVHRVMTGAPLPPGTAFVQRVEYTRAFEGRDDRIVFELREKSDNIIRRGENLRAGDILLGPRRLGPADIGILASSGFAKVSVARRPIVGIISTGDELEAAGATLGPASIYDSNGPQLAAQVEALGALPKFYGIVRDEEAALRGALERALAECEVIVLSGGVSMGDFDYVPKTLEALGVRRIFHKLAMKPGKPTWFGTRGTTAVFGLPGNPLSTFVNFEVFLGPHLEARMGVEGRSRILSLPLGAPLSRKSADRAEYLPVRLAREGEGGRSVVHPLDYHGSSMLSVLAEAEGLARLEIGVYSLPEGGHVDVRLLRS